MASNFERENEVCFANTSLYITEAKDTSSLFYLFILLCLITLFATFCHLATDIWIINPNKSVYLIKKRKKMNNRHGKKFRSSSCPPYIDLSKVFNVENMEEDSLKNLAFRENANSISEESTDCYSHGGYMPIQKGGVLSGYEIIRKLGFGQFSTVWFAKKLIEERLSTQNYMQYVAIKISRANDAHRRTSQEEVAILKYTKKKNRYHVGYRNVIQIIDHFSVESENGQHHCVALEVMGPSLLHLIKLSNYKGIQISGIRRIIKQVLYGLRYLHEECKLIHTDIKPENVLIKVNDAFIQNMARTVERLEESGIALPKTYVTSCSFNEKDQTIGDIYRTIYSQTTIHQPEHKILEEIINGRENWEAIATRRTFVDENIEIKIGDLGNATFIDDRYPCLIQTRQYRALEVIIDAGYNTPSDLWSVGCMAFELATGEFLFGPRAHRNVEIDVDHLTLIWEALGGIPEYVINTGKQAANFFINGRIKNMPEENMNIWRIEDVLVDKYNWRRVDAIPFAGFIESLIEPDPSLRATALSALSSNWFNE